MEIKIIRKDLKEKLKKSRYEHTLGVEYTSAALAMRYGVDIEKARLAGLLHDCAKNISDEKQLELCKKYKIEISSSEQAHSYLLHGKLGAYMAEHKYEVTDDDVLNAIRFHTTGRKNMSILEKIIFTADYIEPSRNKASRLGEIRQMAFIDIDKAMIMIFEDTIGYVISQSGEEGLDQTTREAYEYLRAHM